MANELISEKIKELIELSKEHEELATASMLLSIMGARTIGQEGILCSHISKFVAEILLPLCLQGKQDKLASGN